MAERARTAARGTPASVAASPTPKVAAVLSLLMPGLGHLVLGRTRKAAIFFVILNFMFLMGLAFGGRLFPFQLGEPLVFLAAAAEWAMVVPRLAASMFGAGRGDVVAITYEYGNTFLIVSGLLNMLSALDAADRAAGRKPR